MKIIFISLIVFLFICGALTINEWSLSLKWGLLIGWLIWGIKYWIKD